MIKPPPLYSLVYWKSNLYQVRDRSRNKSTGEVTLWLCAYSSTICNLIEKVPLDEVHLHIETKAEINAFIASELAAVLEQCHTYQEVIDSTCDCTDEQKATAWQLLPKEQKNRIRNLKSNNTNVLVQGSIG